VCGLEIQRRGERETETELESGIMSSPSNATKWMSYLAEGFLAEEEVQPSTPFFWCNGQQPVGQVDCSADNECSKGESDVPDKGCTRKRYV
jgi:hypothetical protein